MTDRLFREILSDLNQSIGLKPVAIQYSITNTGIRYQYLIKAILSMDNMNALKPIINTINTYYSVILVISSKQEEIII